MNNCNWSAIVYLAKQIFLLQLAGRELKMNDKLVVLQFLSYKVDLTSSTSCTCVHECKANNRLGGSHVHIKDLLWCVRHLRPLLRSLVSCCPADTISASITSTSPMKSCLFKSAICRTLPTLYASNFSGCTSSK